MRRDTIQYDLHSHGDASRCAMHVHLLGSVPFDDFLRMQRRLVYELGGYDDGRMIVLLCEHPSFISVGRAGSRGHIRLTNEQLRLRQLAIRWVSRGGGCVLHGPGQLAVYPLVPVAWHGWTVAEYLGRLRSSVLQTLDELRIRCHVHDSSFGIWGRSGQLVSCGVAVRNWISCHGMFVNVNPSMTHYPFVDNVDPRAASAGQKTTMGSLFAERRNAVTIPRVRATLIPHLASAFGTERYHLFTGHPLLAPLRNMNRESRHRAS